MTPQIRTVGPEAAAEVLAVIQAAFGARPPLDPPADAASETEETIAERLVPAGGLLATLADRVVGVALLDPTAQGVFLRRVGVMPEAQHAGVAHHLVRAALSEISRQSRTQGSIAPTVRILAREELPRTVRFWRDMGFVEVSHQSPYVEMARPAPVILEVPTAEDMHTLAERLASGLRAGDVLVLTGELGAGKTTFTQGLGAGLGVRGPVTSPTFVIARVHPSLVAGPELVHVDAYRLGGVAELDDLDLDADLEQAVTVVEWGSDLAEGLAESRLEIRIQRASVADPGTEPDPRIVEIDPVGGRWLGVDVAAMLERR
ncbi:MAG: tRNA (adenosine(37)-N6)-threonylcarbamoyltransferase complex ATPase subunit type 1 TsaE [Nocardioidaceae bacterium]|nr:tRNA (adenosine(37)-N6)-threonylcarbamoyltransferase complex ATPase subunit type 1 TsaE [Nocardioidaceae bacterium]